LRGSPSRDRDPADAARARLYALKLLGYRGRSEKELRERLSKKGFDETAVSETIVSLKHAGLVDDSSLAETLTNEAFSRKMLSRSAAKQYLRVRGIPAGIIETTAALDAETDADNAKRLMHKKLKALRHYPREIVRRRLYNVLARRGYSSGTIRTVLKDEFLNEEE